MNINITPEILAAEKERLLDIAEQLEDDPVLRSLIQKYEISPDELAQQIKQDAAIIPDNV